MSRPSRYVAGQRYERLVMISSLPGNRALCRCDCGVKKSILIPHLNNGLIRSCGCLRRELAKARLAAQNFRHGMAGTPVYLIWQGMKTRCENPAHRAFDRYGGRGITVCKRWSKFENFLADMGLPPAGLTLERKNNNRGYSPHNCTWASRSDQQNNRKACVRIRFQGHTKTISQWAYALNVPRGMLYDRYYAGWTVKRMLTEPSRVQR